MRQGATKAIPPGMEPGRSGGERGTLRTAILLMGVLLALLGPSVSLGMDRVRAELGKESAWTGEAVPLIITLYSPGPFSGTASFDLPEAPRSAFVRVGNPLVGSEQVGDKSYFTQRHEFAIYTQQDGEIVIPAFRVRFAGKKSFTSPAEALEGFTRELRFRSQRPPGTQHLGVVVAARKMEVDETWQPSTVGPIQAGDVIERTITRRAEGATAMMLPPIRVETPEGVRHYANDPTLKDFTERGASQAVRSETIKYQFERPGTFQLPDLPVIWWDPDAGELKRVTLPGKWVDVKAADPVSQPPSPRPESRWPQAGLFLLICLAAWAMRKPAKRLLAAWQARRDNPTALAARRFVAACRTDAADEAYSAGLQWKRAVKADEASLDEGLPVDVAADFKHEWNRLSRHVYGVESESPPWTGGHLAGIFADVSSKLGRTSRARDAGDGLPALNPATPPARRDR